MTFIDQFVRLPLGPVRVQSRGTGPVVFWTHGVFHPIDVDDYSSVGVVLRSVDHCRIVRYDSRGHGKTPAADQDDPHLWDSLADELFALADALHIDRFIAGGISMGAAVSLHAAVKDPRRVMGLVLMAPPTAWDTREDAQGNYLHLASLPGPDEVADHVARDLMRDFEPEPVPVPLRMMVDGLRDADPVALGRVLRGAARSDLPLREAVARLEIPALVMPWENDAGHPVSTAIALKELMPHAELHVLESVNDVPGMLETIQTFLTKFS